MPRILNKIPVVNTENEAEAFDLKLHVVKATIGAITATSRGRIRSRKENPDES